MQVCVYMYMHVCICMCACVCAWECNGSEGGDSYPHFLCFKDRNLPYQLNQVQKDHRKVMSNREQPSRTPRGARSDSALRAPPAKGRGEGRAAAGCAGPAEAAGKHVSSDTSSVCLGFWLPGTTSPQIERRPAKSKRFQGCAESHTKIKVTPHASPCKDSLVFLLVVPCWEGNPVIKL